MNVKDFILQHPKATLDMMTPGGYVYLTPEKSKDLIEGGSTIGHPGDPAFAVKLSAEELLPQTIESANYSKGVWHILTGYSQEETQGMEQEVTMC